MFLVCLSCALNVGVEISGGMLHQLLVKLISVETAGMSGIKTHKIQSWQLQFRQNLPLWMKIKYAEKRIINWYERNYGKVYVAFSGGKDSTVLLHLVRGLYPNVPAVFINTGLEYPEIVQFVRKTENVIWLYPKMSFKKVLEKYGYPVVSKENAQKLYEIKNTKSDKLRNIRLFGSEKGNGKLPEKWKFLIDADFKISDKCCSVMKKRPAWAYEKTTGRKPFIGTMASDSSLRKISYLRTGCNSFETKRPISAPLAFWIESDIWEYLHSKEIPYSSIYDLGFERTGCMFCMFGVHMEKGENRFQRMKKSHPKQYDYCINKLGMGEVLDILNVNY